MKKSIIALILLAVLIIIVSPGIVGKLAEDSVGDNLNWAAEESGELIVTSEGFDRGWFSSEGQHRVEVGDGQLRSALLTLGGNGGNKLPVLIINTHIDHGLIPVSSMSREEGSLAPGLGSAVSTVSVEMDDGETITLPGKIYSKVGLSGDLDSNYILEAGNHLVDGGEVSWEQATIQIISSANDGSVEFDGEIGAMTFGNTQQTITIDGLTMVGDQSTTRYGFNVGAFEMSMGEMSVDVGGIDSGGMQSMNIKASAALDGDDVAGDMLFEISGQTIPGFGDISVIADFAVEDLDAEALGRVSARLDAMAGTQDPTQLWFEANEELQGLFAEGFVLNVEQLDVGLPMGTVEVEMNLDFAGDDSSDFEWTSLLLDTTAEIDIIIPEALVQMATSMDPQVGMYVGLGYLKKDGDNYVMDADFEKGLLTINGAPIPIPLGAFQ